MLPRPLLEQATTRVGIDIVCVYGSSEASCATGSVPEDDREHRLADDGVLMPGTEVRIGSANSPQEGLLRGPCVMLGYVDPDDDAAAFEDGWFRTGDLVEVHDGRLAVVGRLKEVVNRNGLKISLTEIDAALAAMPDLDEYACFAAPDPDTGERLALAVRPAPAAPVMLDDVVAYLVDAGAACRKLPEQLVTWDAAVPRTPSGKVVRSGWRWTCRQAVGGGRAPHECDGLTRPRLNAIRGPRRPSVSALGDALDPRLSPLRRLEGFGEYRVSRRIRSPSISRMRTV